MMFIFPLIYLSAFIFALKGIMKGEKSEILLFFIFSLPIYISSLSIAFSLGLRDFIGVLQAFKEIIVLILISYQLIGLQKRIRPQLIDYMVLAYLSYTFLYTLIPIGDQGFVNRLIAFKSLSFFTMIYFCGRLFDLKSIYLSKYFHYILYLTLAAAIIVLLEYVSDQHFQTLTAYADYNFYLFNVEPTGDYGLSFTFQSEGGFKRFASFFANPLEHAAGTLIALAVIAALYTRDDYKFKPDLFGKIVLAATLISIILALSRAAFASYFIMIYMYAILTRKKFILYAVNAGVILGTIYLFYIIEESAIQEVIINTLNFSNPSSVGHVLEWIEGITSMINNPLGLGLGTSGRVGGSLGEKTGGENQFLIIGVQAGIAAISLYIAIYIALVKTSWRWFYRLQGKEKKVCLMILLIKIGLIIPLFTSELESSVYISYMTWFFSGLFISIIANRKLEINIKSIHDPVISAVN